MPTVLGHDWLSEFLLLVHFEHGPAWWPRDDMIQAPCFGFCQEMVQTKGKSRRGITRRSWENWQQRLVLCFPFFPGLFDKIEPTSHVELESSRRALFWFEFMSSKSIFFVSTSGDLRKSDAEPFDFTLQLRYLIRVMLRCWPLRDGSKIRRSYLSVLLGEGFLHRSFTLRQRHW